MVTRPKVIPKPTKAHCKPVALTSAEARKWDETLAACNWTGPGFIHILYTMLVPKGRQMAALFTLDLPWTAATDGYQIIINPKRFFEFSLKKRQFIIFHEIMHNVWDHCGMGARMRHTGVLTWDGKSIPYIHWLAGSIMDLIINDCLIESKMGEFDTQWLHDTTVATYMDSWVEVYYRVYKKLEKQCRSKLRDKVEAAAQAAFGEGGGEADQPDEPATPRKGQFDLHMDPGTGGNDGQEERAETPERSAFEWQQAVAAGMAVAKAQGKLPSALELTFGEILEPKVHWREHVRAFLARKIGSGGFSWQRPDRRLIVRDIIAPGRTGHGCRLIVVGGDNSGSIYSDPTLLGRFLGEVGGMLEDLNPEQCILIWCDAKVHEVDEVVDASDLAAIQKRGTTGGGGTSFVPVFEWIEKQQHQPDALIYLTDGMGRFPSEAPSYPVLWGMITDVQPPFGEVVKIPVE